MKLYHYVPKENTVLKEGLKSFSKHPYNLRAYAKPAGSENTDKIISWLDSTFPGRSRSISCLTEPIKPGSKEVTLKYMQKNSVLVSFELDELINNGLVESIWCRDGENEDKTNRFYKVVPNEIDVSPLAWDDVDSRNGKLFNVIKHYMIVLKDGVIPPEYLKIEPAKQSIFSRLSRLFKF